MRRADAPNRAPLDILLRGLEGTKVAAAAAAEKAAQKAAAAKAASNICPAVAIRCCHISSLSAPHYVGCVPGAAKKPKNRLRKRKSMGF